MRPILIVTGVVLTLVQGIFAQTTSSAVPRLETGQCHVPAPEGVRIECRDLIVPESRRAPSSRTIKLPVVIIKSTSATPEPDPIIYTAGGPGAGSLGRVSRAGNLVPYLKDRDYIVFEQRGTQFADPNLACPEVTDALHAARRTNVGWKRSAMLEVAAAKQCHDRLISAGIDLSAYNSVDSAADMNDLRKLLGIRQWNLYGISYSTRLMQNYIRAFPGSVRSAILDSTLPTTANWDETSIGNVLASLKAIIDACYADAECKDKYPKLEEKFYSVIARLDRIPVFIEAKDGSGTAKIRIDGRDFADLIYNMLEGGGSMVEVPKVIEDVLNGDQKALKAYAEDQLTSGGFIWGMRYSVWCTEEMPFESRIKINAELRRFPRLKGFSIQGALPDICRIWNVPAAQAVENQKVSADVPVLVFAGKFDPDTPTDWGKMVASWFKHGYYFENPASTHGAMNDRCTYVQIPIEFLRDPGKRPDGSCLQQTAPLKFK